MLYIDEQLVVDNVEDQQIPTRSLCSLAPLHLRHREGNGRGGVLSFRTASTEPLRRLGP